MISLNLSFSRVEWLYIRHIYWLKKGWFPAQTWILTIVNRFLRGLKLSKVMKIGFYWHTVISRLSLWGQLPADNTMYVFNACLNNPSCTSCNTMTDQWLVALELHWVVTQTQLPAPTGQQKKKVSFETTIAGSSHKQSAQRPPECSSSGELPSLRSSVQATVVDSAVCSPRQRVLTWPPESQHSVPLVLQRGAWKSSLILATHRGALRSSIMTPFT